MVWVRRLPSLNGVKAFEAAARAGSFAAAAGELHVTPAAVSRLVRLLEQRLGLDLFDRHANRLTLTPGQTVKPTPYVTLRPEPGIRMRLTRR